MSVKKFDPEYWKAFLPELPGHGILADYGDTVQVETADGATVPVVIDQAKYFRFQMNNLDQVQKHPEQMRAVMQRVFCKMLEVSNGAAVICLKELDAYHSKQHKADYVKGLFVYGTTGTRTPQN